MNKKLTQQTFHGLFWQFSGTLLTTVLQLGVLFILARLIPKADFGIVQAALIVVGFANLLSQMGVGPALIQKTDLTQKHIRSGVTLSILLSVLLFVIVFFGSGLLAGFFNMPELKKVVKVISVLFILEGITTVSQSLLRRDMKHKVVVKIDFFSYLFGYGIIAIVLSYYGYGLWSLIFGQLVQSGIKCMLSYFASNHAMLPLWSVKEMKELMYFGGGFTLARLFNYIANQGDNIVTGRYLGADALGVYSRAYAIMVRPVSLIGHSIDRVLFPAMSARQNQTKSLTKAFISGSNMIIFLCIPISTVIIFSSNEIINVLLGSKWVDAVIPLQILTTGLVFRMGYKMSDSLTKATGNVYNRAKRNFIYVLCILVGCYVGSFWGIVGVAGGTLFGVTINYILMTHLSLTILKIRWFFFVRKILPDFFIACLWAILFIGVISITRLMFSSHLLVLIISYSVYGVISVFLIYMFWNKLSFINLIPIPNIIKARINKKSTP